ncbi:MAG: glucose-6-phosphate isomerase [Candidatus Fermentibacter daniensis]|nr:glucose-6-phosphate isomerase [Candidatus Fermentibacter daniensis]
MRSDRGGFSLEAGFDFPGISRQALEAFGEWRRAGRLGFMQLPFEREYEAMCLETAKSFDGLVDDVVLDGIGGSALGARCLLSALAAGPDARPGIHVIDSPDPFTVSRIKESCDPARTLLLVITKSGSTAETMSLFLSFHDWLPEDLRDSRIVTVTDPARGDLRRLSTDRGWPSLPVPPSVGGRYSVLSPVGLLPAALAGIDTSALLDGAASSVEDFDSDAPGSLAGRLAACWLSHFVTHPVHVFFVYCDRLYDTALWFSQLWAESLGKTSPDGSGGIGQTPLACRGPADQHSLVQLFMEGPSDKFFTFLEVGGPSEPLPGGFQGYPSIEWLEGRTLGELRSAEASATASALEEKGLPVCRLSIDRSPDAFDMGRLLCTIEIATVLTGLSLGIDPLDQPGVERGKYLTFKQMGRPGWN